MVFRFDPADRTEAVMLKNRITRALLLLLSLVLLSALLVSCGEKKGGLKIAEEGKLLYTIVRPELADKTVSSAAARLRTNFVSILGGDDESVSLITDWDQSYDWEEIGTRREILVGKTNRPESAAAAETLGPEEVCIKAVGNKIVILGFDDAHTALACEWFLSEYCGFSGKTEEPVKTLSLPENLNAVKEMTVPVTASDKPVIVQTKYETEDVVVADIVAGAENYGVDPTGEKDSTAGITKALKACESAGGGTVFLPAGTYKITKSFKIPAYVTLRGDWQDPDLGHEYGTILLMDIDSKDNVGTGTIQIGGSGGAYGLTVYYPAQSIDDVKPYPFTFYVPGSVDQKDFMASTVRNVTIINGYYGVGACTMTAGHEQLTVENLKGTFLNIGLFIGTSSDVGTCTNIEMSPKYWLEFAEAMGYEKPDEAKLKAYTRKNAVGLHLADVEWTQYTHLTLTDLKYGVNIVHAQRIQFAGCFFDTIIRDTDIAVLAEDLDSRWGAEFSNCWLSGSEYGIVNESRGMIKLAGTTVQGGTKGDLQIDTDNLSEYVIDTYVSYKKPNAVLYTGSFDKTGKTDIGPELQKLLDEAGKTGGIVYLPGGNYLLNTAVKVPEGVELRGSSPIANREEINFGAGTRIFTQYGHGGDDKATALVTLSPSSGVNGIRFIYDALGSAERESAYTVRGTGADVYCVNCCVTGSGRGIDFSGCDNHLIKKLTSYCYINDVRVGGKNGTLTGFLHNATIRLRLGYTGRYNDVPDMDPNYVARIYNTTIEIVNAENERIWSAFSYGVAHMVSATDSTGTLIVNLGSDNIGDSTAQHVISGGDYTAINIMRYNGISYEAKNGAKVTLYSRLAIGDKFEDTVKP